jgi:putative N6-adenine-specific DNA methylase
MKLVAKTLYGLEDVLAKELESIGGTNVKPANRAVSFTGSKALLYRSNYCLRSALSVLSPVAEFFIRSRDDLYRRSAATDWSEIMDPDSTFSVAPVVNSKLFTHTGYPGLIVKDAIADHFRKKSGRRPSVNTDDPDLLINLHISNDRVTLSLDSSVIPLYKRGYRIHQGPAPLNEVLAAGILMLSGWDTPASLTDPMCGSGTILIEAGLMANRIPPGKFRKSFGFMRWKDFEEDLFQKVRNEADSQIIKSNTGITGSDISEQAVAQADANIKEAGLADLITVKQADFNDIRPAGKDGFIIFNPPYGQRLNPDETDSLYGMIGTALKHNFAGNKAWVLTAGKENLNGIGLKPARKYTVYNGALQCIFAGYDLYEGSRRQPAG